MFTLIKYTFNNTVIIAKHTSEQYHILQSIIKISIQLNCFVIQNNATKIMT